MEASTEEQKWAHIQLLDENPKYKKLFMDMKKLAVLVPELEQKAAEMRLHFDEVNTVQHKRTNRTWEIAYSRWRSAYDLFNRKSNALKEKRVKLMEMIEERVNRRAQRT